MTLGQLIALLEAEPGDNNLCIAAPMYMTPGQIASYRGYYEDLAIAPVVNGPPVRVDKYVPFLKASLGRVFIGYKGGEYTASETTWVWASPYYEASRARISGVSRDDGTSHLTLEMKGGKPW